MDPHASALRAFNSIYQVPGPEQGDLAGALGSSVEEERDPGTQWGRDGRPASLCTGT